MKASSRHLVLSLSISLMGTLLNSQTITVEELGEIEFIAAEPGAAAPVTGNTKILNPDGTLSDAAWSAEPDTTPGELDALWRDRVTWGGLAPEMPRMFTIGSGNLSLLPSLQTVIPVVEGSYDVYVLYSADRRPLQPEWTEGVGNAGGAIGAAITGQPLEQFDAFNGTFTGLVGSEINTQLGYDFNLWGVFMAMVGTVENTDSISVDIAPYAGDLPEGPYRPTYHGIALVPLETGPALGDFSDYEIVDGFVDTGDWMGSVWIESYPWVWSADSAKWLYAGTGGWFYFPK